MTTPRPLLPALFLLTAGCGGCQPAASRVVVYSAQDREYAEAIFSEFESASSLKVNPKFDTEAQKSVGLARELAQEAGRPRCDVHWNNEPLGTIRLARQGVYEPYAAPAAAEYPARSAGAGNQWQGFAERARVIIVNTNLVPESERPRSLLDLTAPRWKGRVAMAKPQFGTTASHAACLFEVLGSDAARQFYRDLHKNDVGIVAGNKQVAIEVRDGRFWLGITDTDDAIIEVLAGRPVAIIFPDAEGHPLHPRLGTLFLPNTLALVKGGPNPEAGKKLISFLLRPETESMLASGGGYQLPLHPRATGPAHPMLKSRRQVKAMDVGFEKAADLWDETQAFLRQEFAP